MIKPYVLILILCGAIVISAYGTIWLISPDIDENRHITIANKCCNFDSKCFVWDTNNQKYEVYPDARDYEHDPITHRTYDSIIVGKSYTVAIYKSRIYSLHIVRVLEDDPDNPTCEALGLNCSSE